MRDSMLAGLVVVTLMSGCGATAPRVTATPPPFKCTSAKSEICDMQQQLHTLRFEQAEQNAAIDAAERRRKAANEFAANADGSSAYATESPVPATTVPLQRPAPL